MRLTKYLLLVLLIASIAGCADLFGGGNDEPAMDFARVSSDGHTVVLDGGTLRFEPADVYRERPPFDVMIENGDLLVEGYFYLGCTQNKISGSAKRSGDAIRIHIASEEADQCPSIPGMGVTYNARINDLSEGPRKLIITHFGDGLTPGFERIEEEVLSEEFIIE